MSRVDESLLMDDAGLVVKPVYPCYKSKGGLCRLRTIEKPSKFECGQTPDTCQYLREKTKGDK